MKRLLALEASAGSGKTFNLSARFVALILEKTPNGYRNISNILAITFTNKACGEMKSNIIETFLNLDPNESENLSQKEKKKRRDRLNEIAKMLETSPENVLKARDERMSDFLGAKLRIHTFDAFFAQILRQFSLNLGLLPNFDVSENISSLVNSRFIFGLSASELAELAGYLNESGDNIADLFSNLSKIAFSQPPKLELSPNPSQEKVLKAYEAFILAAKAKAQPKNQKYFTLNKEPREIVNYLFAKKLPLYIQSAKSDASVEFQNLENELRQYFLDFERFKLSHFFALAKKYKEQRINFLKEQNLLEFSDVSEQVFNLLRNKEAIDINYLYFRLDARIGDILIDEFQDTDEKQYLIMLPLIDEIVAGAGQNGVGSFFYVGDTKQSIYRFRGSHKEIFNYLISNYQKNGTSQIAKESLKENYRSTKNIVEFINANFKGLYENFEPQALPPSDEIFTPDDGLVDISCFDRRDNDDFLRLLKEKVEFLLASGAKLSDITILCWENKHILLIKEFLQKNDIKVASKSRELVNAFDVRLVIEQLKNAFFDSNYYEELFYENLGKIIKKPSLELRNTPQMLKYLASTLGLNPYSKNLLKLYEIAASKANIFEFLFDIESDKTQAIDYEIDGLEIMTVHKSKGLGFVHTIVCDKIGQDNFVSEPFLREYDLDTQSWQIRLNEKFFELSEDADFMALKNKGDKAEQEEVLNRLYVALTRAKNNLFILAGKGGNGNHTSYFLPFTSGGEDIKPVLDLSKYLGEQSFVQKGQLSLPEQKKESKKLISSLESFEKVELQQSPSKAAQNTQSSRSALIFGQALHYAFEMAGDFSDKDIKNAIIATKNHFGWALEEKDFDFILARVNNFAKLKKSTFSGDFKAYKELELSFNARILRLDLLLLNQNEAIVIDYKSSLSAAQNSPEQMSLYKNALFGILNKPVRAFFAEFAGENCNLREV